MEQLFDLNIEQVLEHWEPEHAVREIIANALDEQELSQSEPIQIYKNENVWHVRDYGRGIQYIHFTQNENREKLDSPNLIGKFGVGLKDALAVFYRKGINIEIDSKYAHITLKMSRKAGFDINTLHADFSEPKNPNMVGTDVSIFDISDEIIDKAKSMFLVFHRNTQLLETTRYGEVYSKDDNHIANIYINGVRVAEEDNFLFSYNITNINSQIKKAINRERSNVGRTAYSDTIKNILRQCKSDSVLLPLVIDLENVMRGTNCDESGWIDIASYAAQTLNQSGNVVFMTPTQRANMTNQQVEILQQSGKKLILITESVFLKIGGSLTTFDEVYNDYNDSFEYDFIDYHQLTKKEKKVYNSKEIIITFLKKYNYKYNIDVVVSETIRIDAYGNTTLGLWDNNENCIIIKRSTLSDIELFLGTLLHEFAHYTSGFTDNTREFENVLTEMLGKAMYDALKQKEKHGLFHFFR